MAKDKRSIVDPLEAAKASGGASSEVEVEVRDLPPDLAPEVSGEATEAEPEVAPEPPKRAKKVPLVKVPRYRVLETRQFSWQGQITHLRAGSIISAEDYGQAGMEMIISIGTKLEPVEV